MHPFYNSEIGLKPVLSSKRSLSIQDDASEETATSSLQNWMLFHSGANGKHRSNHSGKFSLQNPGVAMKEIAL